MRLTRPRLPLAALIALAAACSSDNGNGPGPAQGDVIRLWTSGDDFEDLALAADAVTLAWFAAGHNRAGADANLRVRLVDEGGTTHTLHDWETCTGEEDVRCWEERMVSIAAYAGQVVTLVFEQDDNGPGTHEQVYIDEVRILRD